MAQTPLALGCYKMNVDGSHLHNFGSFSCSGIVRDSNDRFVSRFYKIGIGNALWAELWGIRMGLRLARLLKLQHVQFDLNSKVWWSI